MNEVINESQREATGGTEREDVSRYEVTIRRSGFRHVVRGSGVVLSWRVAAG